jgi:hypothetical protein
MPNQAKVIDKMHTNIRMLIFSVLLVSVILPACNLASQPAKSSPQPTYSTSLTQKATVISTPSPISEQPLATGTPATSVPMPTQPAFLEFYYDEQICGIDIPDRFTSMHCYSINEDWFALGLIAYSENDIDFISISHYDTAPQLVVDQSTKFVTNVALFGGWNMDDLNGATKLVEETASEEWITYNTIEAKRVLIPESNVVVYGYERKQ